MTPLDLAWSVLKADPNMQAFEAGGYHPETGVGNPNIRNLGTVDPAVLAMGYRQLVGHNPQENVSRLMSGARDTMRTYPLPLQAQGQNPYETEGDGFEGLGEGSQDYFGVSRQPRPQASPRRPPARSPQHIIDSFMADGSPMTPEDEAELAARLRRNEENLQRRTFRDGIERLMND